MTNEISADKAKSIKNKVETLTQEDKDSLNLIYNEIRSISQNGGSLLILDSSLRDENAKNIHYKVLDLEDKRLDRDVFETLERLDYRVLEFSKMNSDEYRTLISWRDSDLAEFSEFAFGLSNTGGFPII